MKRTVQFLLLLFVSILINILQTTVLAPSSGKFFFPDLNLIFIVFLAVSKEVPFGLVLAIINGFIMDIMSGYMLGINTFSRLSLYIILRSGSTHFDYENNTPVFVSLFLGTLYVWTFVWFILILKSVNDIKLDSSVIIYQAMINSLVGIAIFKIKNRIYATVQK